MVYKKMDAPENSEVVEQDNLKIKTIDFEYTGDFFFSDYVLELVTKVFANDVNEFADKWENLLNTDLTFNLPYLDIILDRLLVTKDVSYDCTVELNDYLDQVVPVIKAVFRHYDQIYQFDKTGAHLLSIVEPHLYWLGNWKQYFIDAIHIALNDEPVFKVDLSKEPVIRNILALAIITSGTEQALGNLILTQSHFVPPLLKTLLTMSELEALIDIRLIRLLKVIVGPPTTINLRNILWHGFVNSSSCFVSVSTNEIVNIDLRQFIYFLLAINCTIGVELMKESSLHLLKIDTNFSNNNELKSKITLCIPQRKLYSFDEFAFKLEHTFPIINNELLKCENYLQDLLLACPLIHRTLRPLWSAALSLYFDTQNCYRFYSFCLLMPLLESSLRYLYCSLNQLSNRLLTAISREYYVTFTEILSFHALADGEEVRSTTATDNLKMNCLFNHFPRPLVVLLLDTILLPEGLRFRDRLSHGQVDLHSINCTVANYVICSVIAVIQISTQKLGVSETISIPPIIQQITGKCITKYECLFHPLYQLKTQLSSFIQSLLLFVDISNSTVDSQQFEHYNFNLKTYQKTISSIEYDLFEPNIADCDQLVLLLRNCATNYERFITNLTNFISTRSKELKQCKLRSRQRTNYQSMLTSVPLYLETFASHKSAFWRTLLSMMSNFQQTIRCWSCTAKEKLSLEKLLKRLLQCSQNLAQQSQMTTNRWEVVDKLIHQQKEVLELLFNKISSTDADKDLNV